jgi:hypothetical protein
LSNEEKTNDFENFEKGMIYMKILKKGGTMYVSKWIRMWTLDQNNRK